MTPSAIRATVRDYIRAYDIFRPGPVVVAVSGGADSTALLLLLAELADELGLVLHVAHFDHRTRPKESAQDAEFVARLANRVGAPIRVGRAAKATTSEESARTARYEFLRRAAREIGATAIATGHTRDDQAETVLLHLARGTGIGGLAGMRPVHGGIARPLLAIGRADTVAICRAAHIRPRADPTNRSLRFARNRVRLKVIPELAKINPRVQEAIARLAAVASELNESADRATGDALAGAAEGDTIDLERIAPERRADVLALAWERATGRTLTARHRDALARLVETTNGSRTLDLPGGRITREYATAWLGTPVPAHATTSTVIEPGREISWNGWRVGLEMVLPGGVEALVPVNFVRDLTVRNRRPGDRIADGRSTKLQDAFVDAKVPASQRGGWPVIAVKDTVWWVPGLTEPPREAGGTRLAVAAPAHFGNDLWTRRVRQVASKAETVAKRPRKGRPN